MRILGKTILDKDLIEIYFSQILSITGGIIAGVFLLNLINLEILAGLFILFPGLLELHGNIYGSLSARLGNLLLMGKLKDSKEKRDFIIQNIFAVLFLIIFVSFILGLIAYLFIYLIFGINNQIIILVSMISSIIGSFFEIPVTFYVTFWVYRHRLDPEDVMGPYITTMSDIISIISLVLIVKILT